MAFALTHILIALAGKANVVSFFTGIAPERLVVVHQYVAWAIFALSWVHTIPFFIASYREPGDGGFARVKSKFYRNGGATALTEVSSCYQPALLFFLWSFAKTTCLKFAVDVFFPQN